MSCTAQGADARRGREHSQFARKPPQSREETWACVNQDSDQTEWESSQAEAALSPGSYVALCPCSSVGILSFLLPASAFSVAFAVCRICPGSSWPSTAVCALPCHSWDKVTGSSRPLESCPCVRNWFPPVLFCEGCCDKEPQTGWLKQ